MTTGFKLVSEYQPNGDQPKAIEDLVSGLASGLEHQVLLGVTGSGKTFTLANVIERTQRPAMILAPNKTLAAQLYREMCEYFPENAVCYFVSYYDYYQPEAYVPASNTFIEKDASINEHIEQMRLAATKALLERKDVIVVCTVSAIYGLGDPDAYAKMRLPMQVGHRLDQRQILRKLAEMQYTRQDIDLQRGNFRVRGDVIDIFPADADEIALRVSLFDDEVERLHWFDPLTGEVIENVQQVTIYPKTHYVTPREKVLGAIEGIKTELKARLASFREDNRLVEAQRLEERTRYDLEMMNELGYCTGIENYSRHLSGRESGVAPSTLIDYLPENALLILDESHVMVPQLGAMYKGDRARKENLVNYGFRLPSAVDNRPLTFEEFEAIMPQTIYTSATPGKYELEHGQATAEQIVRPTGLIDPMVEIRPVSDQVDDILSEIHKVAATGQRILITTLTKRMSENLCEYLQEHHVKARYLHSDIDTIERVEILRDLRQGVFDVLIGINLLREGLDLPEVALVAIFDADKEGFLRSSRSLIQTVGRAARHLEGRAILYADRITTAMAQAMGEMDRRREVQIAYNITHGITPKGIKKHIADIIEVEKEDETSLLEEKYGHLDEKTFKKTIKALDRSMKKFAENLDFEKAAEIRNELAVLKDWKYF